MLEGKFVLKATNEPVVGAEVLIMNAPVRPVKTDSNGGFRFEGLGPGRYGLMLSPASGLRTRDTVITLRESQKVTGIEITAFAGATVRGQVRDRRERPAAGLLVSALRVHGGNPRFPPDRGMTGVTSTDDRGEYTLSGLTPGRYALLVETRRGVLTPKDWSDDEAAALPEGSLRDVPTFYPNVAVADLGAPVLLTEGQTLERMDVVLAHTLTYCLRSRIVTPSGQSSLPVRVQIASGLYLGGAVVAEGELPRGGGFEVCGLAPGAYTVLASSNSGEPKLFASDTFTIGNRSLLLPEMALGPAIALSGEVALDRARERPGLPGPVSIALDPVGRPPVTGETRRTQVKDFGSFVIPSLLSSPYWLTVRTPPGFYVKSVAANGTDGLREPIHAAAGGIRIVLAGDAAQLAVLATNGKSEPLAGGSVIVGRDPLPSSYAPGDLVSVLCDQNGQATVSGLAPGRYRVMAFSEAWVDPGNAGSLFQTNRLKGEEVTLAPEERRSMTVRAVDGED